MSVDPTQYPYPPQPPQPWIYQVPPPIASAPMHVHWPVPGGPGFVSSGGGASGVRIAFAAVGGFVLFMLIAAIVIPSFLNQRAKRAGASGQPEGTQIAIDGHASLPGGHAQMTFEPLPTQVEWIRESNIDAPYDGSQWWVACPCSDDYMLLQYYTFKPPIDSEPALRAILQREENRAAQDAGRPVTAEMVEVGHATGYRFRYLNTEGREVLRVMVFGPVHSVRFECNVDRTSPPKFQQCEQALTTLTVDA